MEIALVNYSNSKYKNAQKELNRTCFKFGITKLFSYNDKWLKKQKFYAENKKILDAKRGGGYWAWKPFVILTAMNELEEGDILIYMDSGANFVKDITILAQLCKENKGILLFDTSHKNEIWTKRDCFVEMKCDSNKYWKSNQAYGTYQVYEKNNKSLSFLKEYLFYCTKSTCITDDFNQLGKENFFVFKDHRHDQSILTNIAIKNKIKLFPDPSQFGNEQKRPYPQLIDSHRDTKRFRSKIRKLLNKLNKLIKELFKTQNLEI